MIGTITGHQKRAINLVTLSEDVKYTRILVVGASPDRLNNNTHLRGYVTKGFRSLLGDDAVHQVGLEDASKVIPVFQPNLVLIFGSCMPDQSAYLSIRKICDQLNIKVAFWLHDDPYEFDYSFKAEEFADYVFSNDRWASLHYRDDKTFHLPLAACKNAHFRPWISQKKHQIFFCGVAFPNRIQLISDLSQVLNKYSTFICGREWPNINPYINNVSVPNDDMPDLVASSWTTLNIGRNFNLANDRFQLDPSTPGPRTFEAAMAGTVQFYFSDSLEIEDYFIPDQEILLFDSPSSFALQIEKILDQPDTAMQIALAAQDRALRDHTYENRCAQLLNHCASL